MYTSVLPNSDQYICRAFFYSIEKIAGYTTKITRTSCKKETFQRVCCDFFRFSREIIILVTEDIPPQKKFEFEIEKTAQKDRKKEKKGFDLFWQSNFHLGEH